MNGKVIRQSLAILALGFVTITAGCKQAPKDAAYFEACYGSHARAAARAGDWRAQAAYRGDYRALVAACGGGPMVDVHTIDRALTYNEISSQYNEATANEFVAQGLNH